MGRRTRNRHHGSEAVELTLTSMLDVIFNILAFFVAIYSPPTPERNFDITLPPPKVAGAADKPMDSPDPLEEDLNPFQDVTITLSAGVDGTLAGITLEQMPVQGGLPRLAQQLRLTSASISGATGKKLEAATIVASPKLKYRYLIAAIDSCYQADIRKINFAEPAKSEP